MAKVFLSYDRDDAERAGQFALALEMAGHAVWWDQRIRAGTEFSREIEEALDRADAVVVLWSRQSVDSAWVRDEAAAGRDRGRLVPVRLDETNPPMGFRQYQTIDLSSWKGRGKPPRLQEILTSIGGMAGEQVEGPARILPVTALPELSRTARLLLITALLFAAITLAYFFVNRDQTSDVPVVAVAAADNSRAARSLADDLFIKLGCLQAAKADALQLIDQGSESQSDLLFRVGQRGSGEQIHANVVLLAGDNGGLLWSREFEQGQRREADIRQQLAYSAAKALACATEAMSADHEKLKVATLKLYLSGCVTLFDGSANEPRSLIAIFSEVAKQAPDFEGGWAKLLVAETEAFQRSNLSDHVLRKNLQAHISRARSINPAMAETYIAEAWMQPLRPISGFIRFSDEAVRRNPNHAHALANRSEDMFHVGRVQQAVEDMRQAVRSDPLSPSFRGMLITGLANAGETEAAKRELEEAERLWPGASNLISIRFTLMRRYGDPGEALEILHSGKLSRQFLSPAVESFLEARIDPSPAKVSKAVDDARVASARWFVDYIHTLAKFGRKDELIKVLLERDPNSAPPIAVVFWPDFDILRRDTRFMAIAKNWGLIEYWRSSGKWPDFCFEPGLPYDCKTEGAKLAA